MTYYVTVSGMNGAHDVVSATTNGITVDSTPPILLSLGDGGQAGKDMDYTASASVYVQSVAGYWCARYGLLLGTGLQGSSRPGFHM